MAMGAGLGLSPGVDIPGDTLKYDPSCDPLLDGASSGVRYSLCDSSCSRASLFASWMDGGVCAAEPGMVSRVGTPMAESATGKGTIWGGRERVGPGSILGEVVIQRGVYR